MRANEELRLPHSITAYEIDLICNLLPAADQRRFVIIDQALHASVRWIDAMGQPAVLFDVPDSCISYPENGVIAEATGVDRDGGQFHILLHVRDGKLTEIEFYREDGRAMVARPQPALLKKE